MTHARIAEIDRKQDAILRTAEQRNGTLTPAERQEFDALDAEWDRLANATTGRRTDPDIMPGMSMGGSGLHGARRGVRTLSDIFGRDMLDAAGFSSAHEFFKAVYDRNHQKLGQVVGNDTDGGFMAPAAFQTMLLDPVVEASVVLPRARVFPMTTDTLKVSGFDDSDHSDGTVGGLAGDWTAETGEIDYESATLRRIALQGHKLASLTRASNELLADASSFENIFLPRVRESVLWKLDRAFLFGDGAGKPQGVFNDPALITVSKEGGQAADTFIYENAAKMYARLHPTSMRNAVWVVSQTLLPQFIGGMTIATGTAGQVVQTFREESGVTFLLGLPVVFSEKMAAAGDLGDVLLCDFSKYFVGLLHNGIRIDRSEHARFTTDETVWRTIVRADGQGSWKGPFTPFKGDAQSWCITLEARA